MASTSAPALGDRVFACLDALAQLSEQPDALTRRALTAPHRAAIALVAGWMKEAGMRVRTDPIGNVIGRYEGARPGLPALLLGSHLDTVRDAGRYDGALGVVVPIVCVQELARAGERLPFAIEVVGFCDEEGVRFGSTLLGSRALAGTLDLHVLERRDADGISLAEALTAMGLDPAALAQARRAARDLLGFVEVHIEQGPVLEREGLALGVVSAIAGATRLQVTVTGMAGHAGTVPMGLRRDALAAAAEAILAVEACCRGHDGVVGTVGQIEARPGAVNVIAGATSFSVDVRAGDDAQRAAALARIQAAFDAIATRRAVRIETERTHEADACPCSDWLSARLAAAIAARDLPVRRLPSGAGHDAMAMAALTDVAMLFVRCAGGISHHPDEAMSRHDAQVAAAVVLDLLRALAPSPTAARRR